MRDGLCAADGTSRQRVRQDRNHRFTPGDAVGSGSTAAPSQKAAPQRCLAFPPLPPAEFQLAAGEKHVSRSIPFPKAVPDRDRWCPFKRSHGSVLFLLLTTHADTELRWETHAADAAVVSACKYTHNPESMCLCVHRRGVAERQQDMGYLSISALCESILSHHSQRPSVYGAPNPPPPLGRTPSPPALEHLSYENKGKQNSADAKMRMGKAHSSTWWHHINWWLLNSSLFVPAAALLD